jgi:hypothetical protein
VRLKNNFVSGGGENGVYAVSWGMHEERCTKKVVSDRYKGLGKQELPTWSRYLVTPYLITVVESLTNLLELLL